MKIKTHCRTYESQIQAGSEPIAVSLQASLCGRGSCYIIMHRAGKSLIYISLIIYSFKFTHELFFPVFVFFVFLQ